MDVYRSSGHYLMSYWWRGKQQAHGAAPDIPSAADSARRWVEGTGLEELAAAHPFVEFSGLQSPASEEKKLSSSSGLRCWISWRGIGRTTAILWFWPHMIRFF